MSDLYTPILGNTPVGQSEQRLYNALSSITGTPPSDTLGTGALGAQAAGTALQMAQPSAVQTATQNLISQSGIPTLQGGQQDLAKIFQLYLHDSNLAQQYASPSLIGYQAGSNVPTVASYNQSPDAIINSVTGAPSSSGGFGGFTTPSANTAAMGAVPSVSTNLIDMLGKAVSGQQDLVDKQSNLYSQNYQAAINALIGLGNMYTGLKDKVTPTPSEKLSAKDKGYEWDSKQNDWVPISGTTGLGIGSLSQLETKSEQAKYLRDAYAASGSDGERKRISTIAKQMGISLTPKALSTKEEDDFRKDVASLNKIDSIISTMDKYPNLFPQGFAGRLKGISSRTGLEGTLEALGIPKGAFGIEMGPEVTKALGDLLGMRTEADRLMIAGRLTGYLLEQLKTATPGEEKSIDTNKLHLKTLRDSLLNDLQVIAKNKEYIDRNDLLQEYGLTVPDTQIILGSRQEGNKIRVQSPDGRTGTIDPSELYDAIKNGWRQIP